MSILSRLFGGGKPAEPVLHNGFAIFPEPIKEGTQYRIAARIEKDGKTHRMIRADLIGSAEDAVEATLLKAKMLIDQQGDRLF